MKINISLKDSLFIFFSGLFMSATPGKWGELLKSYLIKELTNEKISKTAPIIFAERITDILSLIILALIGSYIYNFDSLSLIVLSVILIVLIAIIANHSFGILLLEFIGKIKLVKNYVPTIKNLYNGSYNLLKTIPLLNMVLLSFPMWILEFFGFYIILSNFTNNISFIWSGSVYAIAIIAGSFSMFPGGLGFTEGALTILLINKGLVKSEAITATIIIRIFTLWYSVFLGFIILLIYQKKRNKGFTHLFNKLRNSME